MPSRRPNSRPRRLGLFERLESRFPLAADITTGLVHHWTFDETSGDTAADSAGDSDGTLVNWNATEPKWEPGRVGGALRFGTGDNYVLAPQQPASGSYSVSFWLNVAERTGIHPRILNYRFGNIVYINNETGRGVSFSANETSNTFSPEPPTFNTWEHYAVNFNAATGQGVIYRSGAPVAIGTFIDSPSMPNWTFGHHFDITNHDQSLRGALDDLRVYNRLLSDDDVTELASLGIPEPVHQEPVHHWTFDETTGFTAHDIAGGADGVLLNWNQTEPRWEPGKVGGALRFSTDNNAVITPPLGTGAQWSLAFWLNVTEKTGTNPRILTGPDNSDWANLFLEIDRGIGFSSGSTDTFEPTPIVTGAWNHYAITYDTIADVGTIYRDGLPVASGVFRNNSPAVAWVFGHQNDLNNHGDSLNGLLDDLRQYDRLLTTNEIAALAEVDNPPLPPGGLIHHWPFDETIGNIAEDIVGGNDGTLRNWSATQNKWVSGKIDGAVSFNDADDLILTDFPITQNQYTFAFWLNQTGDGGFNPRIVTPGDHREDWVIISQFGDRGVGFAGSDAQDPNLPLRNTWEHYAVTLDRPSGQAAVFRNGVRVDTGTFNELPALQPWYFGHHSDLDIHIDTLHGMLDDMRIYDRLLTDAEVSRLAASVFLLANNDEYSTDEDVPLNLLAGLGVLKNDSNLNGTSKTTVEIDALHGDLVLNEDGSFTYDPDNDYAGPDTFTYRLTDPQGNFVFATVALTVRPVNDAPTFTKGPDLTATDEQYIVAGPRTIVFGGLHDSPGGQFRAPYLEDEFVVTPITGRWNEAHDPSQINGPPTPAAIYGDTENATLEITHQRGDLFSFAGFDLASLEFDAPASHPVRYIVTGFLNGQSVFSKTGEVATSNFESISTPSAALIDTLQFAMQRLDSQAYILDNINLNIPAGVILPGWATNIAAGPPTATDEAAQTLKFTLTNDRPNLFYDQPAINAAGRLTFTPAPNAQGKAKITVTLRDTGGTAQGGVDASSQTFEITITKPHLWHNTEFPIDVNGVDGVTAGDAIDLINFLGAFGSQPTSFLEGPFGNPSFEPSYDVIADNFIAANDVLEVINWLNGYGAGPRPATLVATDTTTQGNWLAKYGADGYALNSGATHLPFNATMSFTGGLTDVYDYVHAASTSDPRALQRPDGSDRRAAEWTGDHGFTLDLRLTGEHRVTFYMLDWEPSGRWQRLDILGSNDVVIDTRALDSFGDGVYLTFLLRGHAKIRFSNLANGLNAVLSGIFID